MRLAIICAVVLLCGSGLCAQDSTSGQPPTPSGSVSPAPAPPPLPPLTARVRLEGYFYRAYGPFTLLGAGLTAGIAQIENDPGAWGRTGAGFGRRYGSLVGRNAISESIQLGLDALDGEDPRYHPSRRHGIVARGFDSAIQAFVPYKVHGGRTFAFSRAAGWFGSGLISNVWYPDGVNSPGDGLVRGTVMIASDVGNNLFWEFWPDVKRKFFHRKAASSKP